MAPRTVAGRKASQLEQDLEVSVVMPCLNEARTLAGCIEEAHRGLESAGLHGEVVVADNGSTDGSQTIARAHGARVVEVIQRGYGRALDAGIRAAAGRYVVMGDADGSYDFGAIGTFVEKLREGNQLVIGNRFQGGIQAGAMPWSHRWVGNPALSRLGRMFFGSPVADFHCGIRAFDREACLRLGLTSTGMEYASEMVIRASLKGIEIAEVPAVLRKDGRNRPPHLRTWRDGWRHLRFMLLFSPRWLFLLPGALLMLAGGGAVLWLFPGPHRVGNIGFDIHTMLMAGAGVLVGYQAIVFALFAEIFAVREGFRPEPAELTWLFRHVRLELGLLIGFLLVVGALGGLGAELWRWQSEGFGALDPRSTMRITIVAAVALSLGMQTIFSSFFLSILGIPRSNVAG